MCKQTLVFMFFHSSPYVFFLILSWAHCHGKSQPTFLYEWPFSLGLGPLQKDPNSREEFDFKQLVEALSSKCSIELFVEKIWFRWNTVHSCSWGLEQVWPHRGWYQRCSEWQIVRTKREAAHEISILVVHQNIDQIWIEEISRCINDSVLLEQHALICLYE